MRALKKKMQREGTFREMKRRKYYEKPSEKRARQKAEAVRRAGKLIRKRLQREGAAEKHGEEHGQSRHISGFVPARFGLRDDQGGWARHHESGRSH